MSGLGRENTTCMRPVSNQINRGRSGSAYFIEYNITCRLGNGPVPDGVFIPPLATVLAERTLFAYGPQTYGGGTCRHRCGARSSKPVAGFTVCGRFDSYASPPNKVHKSS